MSRVTKERSRAYPALSLEESRLAMAAILSRLGIGSFSREVLAEALGYSNAYGGPGARKIAALAQYGLLTRRGGLYSPTPLARRVVEPGDDVERLRALRLALRQPPLFRALLERYAPQGRIPRQLDGVLWRDHGITRKASRAAAETFRSSARYAGLLEGDGTLLPHPEAAAPGREATGASPAVAGSDPGREQRFELALTGGKIAKLVLPMRLSARDLDIVKRQIELLEYQVQEDEEE